ncbi:MAG: S8 family serine peptidase [Nitrospirota bacterium]|nr:S8 family serine peptidase [Nitrospirota bacterium]
MKKFLYLFLVIFLVSCGSQQTAEISSDTATTSAVQSDVQVTAQSIISQMDKAKYKEGEVLVKFKSGVVSTLSLKAHGAVGASVVKKLALVNVDHVRLPQGVSVKDAIISYMQDPNVEYAEPNYILKLSATVPNDLYFGQQWALRNTGQFASGTAGADMKAPEAWDITKESSSVIIAVLDTGIDYSHPDLFDNVISGWNFIDDNGNTMDDFGHGTHVAGIIGAIGNNSIGVSGLMWSVKLLPVKVCAMEGCPVDKIASGISFAISQGAKAMNASFGTSPGTPSPLTLYNAINAANSAGILVVASAGNEENNNDVAPVYPASYNLSNVIAVTATDQNDTKPTFANFGNSVHVAAPGVYILNTVPAGVTFSLCTGSPYAGYDFCSGTSMAAPHVTGLVGLLYSYYDGIHNTLFTYSQVRSTILQYVDVLPSLSGWIQTNGRVNAYKAVASIANPVNLTATATSPTQIAITWSDIAAGESGYKIERKTGSSSFTEIATVSVNVSSFNDSSLTPQTTYTYRVKAYNSISESFYSNEASATTPAEPVPTTGGGGGCSIGARQNTTTAVADFAVMLIPLLYVVVMKIRRRI